MAARSGDKVVRNSRASDDRLLRTLELRRSGLSLSQIERETGMRRGAFFRDQMAVIEADCAVADYSTQPCATVQSAYPWIKAWEQAQ